MVVWRFIGIAVCALCIRHALGRPSRSECLQTYLERIEQFHNDSMYLSTLKTLINSMISNKIDSPKPIKLILDVGLRSFDSSQVFRHMIQLGIRGNDFNGNRSAQCKLQHGNSDLGDSKVFYVHPQNTIISPSTRSWLELIDEYPNSVILNSDISNAEYIDNMKTGTCEHRHGHDFIGEHQLTLCSLPFLHVGGVSVQPRTENFTETVVGVAMDAYRDLVTCAVPKERLFTFDLDEIESNAYWTKLTSFVDPNVSSPSFKRLVRGGLHAQLTVNDVCNGENCAFREVRPNDCRMDFEMPSELPSNMQTCAAAYADEMGLIFGWKYRDLLFHKLMEPPIGARSAPRFNRRIIMGAGPGSTGTRTLHFALIHLNVSSSHYRLESRNCTGHKYEHGMDRNMKLLFEDPDPRHQVLWIDTPSIVHWWYVLQMYPNTRIIMTDVRNETEWMKKREHEHCHKPDGLFMRPHWDVSCTVPMPVDFLIPSRLSKQFYQVVHLSKVSFKDNQRAWAAYRKLLKCVVPQQQLWWLYMKEQTSSEEFWDTMLNISFLTIDPKLRTALVEAGVPHWSSRGCFRGTTKCNYTGKHDPMVAPSVCSFGLSQTQLDILKVV